MTIIRAESGAIDWARVRQRLDRAWRRTEEALSPSGEQERAILDERARVLARSTTAEVEVERVTVLTFSFGPERWAIDASSVCEVAPLPSVTPTPGGPDWLVGVVNLRGVVLPVADIRRLLGVAPGANDGGALLVLGSGRPDLGIVVDEATDLVDIAWRDLHALPALLRAPHRAWVRGVTSDALVVIDAGALLDDPILTVPHRGG